MGFKPASMSSGRSSVRIISRPSESPFADVSELDFWAASNSDQLLDSTGENGTVTIVVVTNNVGMPDENGNTYQWNGGSNPSIYDREDWVIYRGVSAEDVKSLLESNPDTKTVTNDEKIITSDLVDITDGRLAVIEGGRAIDSPYRVDGGSARVEGTLNVEGGTIKVGPVLSESESGGFLRISNAIDDKTYRLVDFHTPTDAVSKRIRRLKNIEAIRTIEVQSDDSEELLSPVSFNYTTTVLATTQSLTISVAEEVTNLRIRISNVSPDNPVPIKFWPSEADFIDGKGSTLAVGQQIINFDDSPIPFEDGRTLLIEAIFDSGKILGDSAGFPKLSVSLQSGKFIESQDVIESVDVDIDAINSIHQTETNQSLTVDLQENGTVLLPPASDCENDDVLEIKTINFNGGTQLTVKNSDNSFVYARTSSGNILSDTSIVFTNSITKRIMLKDNKWIWYI